MMSKNLNRMKKPLVLCLLVLLINNLCVLAIAPTEPVQGDNQNTFLFESEKGIILRFQFYTNYIVRVQAVRQGEDFFNDDHYEMVEQHQRTGTYEQKEVGDTIILSAVSPKGIIIKLDQKSLNIRFIDGQSQKTLLATSYGLFWEGNRIGIGFDHDPGEKFCGMGHPSFGLVESINLAGRIVNCNYGEGTVGDWGYQAVLTVPFYLSQKGYGIFLNSTFPHSFNFGHQDEYGFEVDTRGFDGRMDFFFFLGPGFRDILDRYTYLTGRPRLPQKSIFGLQLSDKDSPDNEGAEWWKNKVTAHRNAGFPFDHIVNDNRWRAGSGAWSGSWFEWDSIRYPDPEAYNQWCKENKVTVTLDLNRNIGALSWGWKAKYNIPEAEKYVKEGNSVPDYTNPEVRNWVWELFWSKSFDPSLDYPGDGLWIDETDELGGMDDSVICANGRSWAENENYYPYLVAKAIVQEGWDNENQNQPPGIGEAKRPFVWIRGGTAGAQRYASHWTGDIKCDYEWMKKNIRAMQTSGLAGFPWFNHDAGGFRNPGPDDGMYIHWAMAAGSFTPIWRPHGPGKYKKWPIDRSNTCQQAALTYGMLRYELMPYLYSYAHQASQTGVPIARAMVLDYQEITEAWLFDLQYLWGDELLIAPSYSSYDTTIEVWLPPGQDWYDFWTDQKYKGGQVISYSAKPDQLPIFVKTGAIIPSRNYAQNTFDLDPGHLKLDIYTGAEATFMLIEDDGVTERYRTKNELRRTGIVHNSQTHTIAVHASNGSYLGAPENRTYHFVFHGLKSAVGVELNGRLLQQFEDREKVLSRGEGAFWNTREKTLEIVTKSSPVNTELILQKAD
jgi:alpha-D-xyloside xylohydrolase